MDIFMFVVLAILSAVQFAKIGELSKELAKMKERLPAEPPDTSGNPVSQAIATTSQPPLTPALTPAAPAIQTASAPIIDVKPADTADTPVSDTPALDPIFAKMFEAARDVAVRSVKNAIEEQKPEVHLPEKSAQRPPELTLPPVGPSFARTCLRQPASFLSC
jgi:hypothetical protein